jgi:rhomboid family protein
MGFYDRDYYRKPRPSWGGGVFDNRTPAVKFIILANVAVFLLQIFVVRHERVSPLERMRRYNPEFSKLMKKMEEKGQDGLAEYKKKHPEIDIAPDDEEFQEMPLERISVIQEWFELDTERVVRQGQIWRLLTHAFCHDRFAIWHILLNMLFLYWFGTTLESMYGTREFLLFYLTAAVIAGLAFVGLDLYTGSRVPAVGASGAVMAVTMLFTMHFPRHVIHIFWVIPVEMRWLMLLYVIVELHPVLLALSGDHMFTGIAHAAHLGGLAFGFLYARYQWRLEPIADRIWDFRFKLRRGGPRLRLVHDTTLPSPRAEMERVDQLLDKILESGQASLTEEERAILQNASERMKSRPRLLE